MVAPAQAATSGNQITKADVVVGPAADGAMNVAPDLAVDFGDDAAAPTEPAVGAKSDWPERAHQRPGQ